MKALSIRQPWAHAILHWGKRIENRSWFTDYRGPVLIHASLWRGDKVGFDMRDATESAIKMAVAAGTMPPGPITTRMALKWPRGGIVGRARIVDCIRQSDSPWFVGPFGFVLADVEPVAFVPFKGALGFFDVPDNALAPPSCPAAERDA